jgi:hypothetical protein
MKVFLIYDQGPGPNHKLAITLPSKWLDQSSDKLKELFVEKYNAKFPDSPLDDEELVLSIKDESPFTNRTVKYLTSSDTPAACFTAGMDVRLVTPPKATASGTTESGKLRCKNFGCQREFTDEENGEGSCRHHAEPPVFHDTRKWWGCCSDIKVLEFDELLAIPGCQVGRHSKEPPAIEVARQLAIAKANAEALERFDRNQTGVNADGSAAPPKQNVAAAAAAPPPKPKVKPNLPEGWARCKHYGCQVDYKIAENAEGVCVYHSEAPLFHEGAKKWVCCGCTKYDFDDFIAVPGCARGRHEPVE